MKIKEKQLAYAFFNSCTVNFKYKDEDEVRTLYTVNEDEILIGGCTSSTGLYKKFFVENMNSVRIYKAIDYTEL